MISAYTCRDVPHDMLVLIACCVRARGIAYAWHCVRMALRAQESCRPKEDGLLYQLLQATKHAIMVSVLVLYVCMQLLLFIFSHTV